MTHPRFERTMDLGDGVFTLESLRMLLGGDVVLTSEQFAQLAGCLASDNQPRAIGPDEFHVQAPIRVRIER